MTFTTFSKRLAATGAASALAAGALVGATSTAAQAATVTNTYTCSNTAMAVTKDIPMEVTGALPTDQYWAGALVPAGLAGNVTSVATIPDAVAGLLVSAGVDGARSEDFGFALGTASVPVPISGPISEDGKRWDAEGTNDPFRTPAPGMYEILLPSAFTIQLEQGDADSIALDCVLQEGTEPESIGSIALAQQTSTTESPKTVKGKKGKAVKFKATVTGDAGPAVGQVIAKKGAKTLDKAKINDAGKAALNLGKLKPGKHKIKVIYKGNASFTASQDTTTVKVAR
jgi:hypothetical protein